MSVLVIGVDPGLSTGVSVLAGRCRQSVFQGPVDKAVDYLRSQLATFVPMDADDGSPRYVRITVACERFQSSGRAALTVQPSVLAMAHSAEHLAGEFGVRFLLQSPADAKRIAPDALLRRSGLWTLPGEVGRKDANDANDATRHAVLVLARSHARIFGELMQSAMPGTGASITLNREAPTEGQ
jgi:hypothetical protein